VRNSIWNLKEVMDDALESKTCIIPFWGVYMMEAKFATEADDKIRDLVYFDRYRRLARVMKKMMGFRKMAEGPLAVERNERILKIIRAKRVSPDNAWWNLVQPSTK
jgi:hypothetical protein